MLAYRPEAPAQEQKRPSSGVEGHPGQGSEGGRFFDAQGLSGASRLSMLLAFGANRRDMPVVMHPLYQPFCRRHPSVGDRPSQRGIFRQR